MVDLTYVKRCKKEAVIETVKEIIKTILICCLICCGLVIGLIVGCWIFVYCVDFILSLIPTDISIILQYIFVALLVLFLGLATIMSAFEAVHEIYERKLNDCIERIKSEEFYG